MNLTQNKNINRNIKTLLLCSIVKTIEITEMENEIKKAPKSAFRLEQVEHTKKELERLRSIILSNGSIGNTSLPNIDLNELNDYLNSQHHTRAFKNFSQEMQTGYAPILLLKSKRIASQLARDNQIANSDFSDKLNGTFKISDMNLALNREIRGTFVPIGTKITALTLASILALNGASHLISSKSDGTDNNHYGIFDIFKKDNSTKTTTPPISNSIDITSYETAVQDMLQKVSEVYKYNTGKDIDLSKLNYDNIGSSKVKVYVASLGNETIRISSRSYFASNTKSIERALNSIGAKYSTYEPSLIFLTQNDKSLAICDDLGNSIKSGKIVIETTNDAKSQIYNPDYINSAMKMMEENGIDSSRKTPDELMGYYLFNNTDQDPELSKALFEVAPLAQFIKNNFYEINNNEDPKILNEYKILSKQFAQKFNSIKTLGILDDSSYIDEKER